MAVPSRTRYSCGQGARWRGPSLTLACVCWLAGCANAGWSRRPCPRPSQTKASICSSHRLPKHSGLGGRCDPQGPPPRARAASTVGFSEAHCDVTRLRPRQLPLTRRSESRRSGRGKGRTPIRTFPGHNIIIVSTILSGSPRAHGCCGDTTKTKTWSAFGCQPSRTAVVGRETRTRCVPPRCTGPLHDTEHAANDEHASTDARDCYGGAARVAWQGRAQTRAYDQTGAHGPRSPRDIYSDHVARPSHTE